MLQIGTMFKRRLSLDDAATGTKRRSELNRSQLLYRSFVRSREFGCNKGQLLRRRKESQTVVKLKEDFMWMQSAPNLTTKPWKLRYIMLLEEQLCYLKEKRDKLNFQVSKAAEWKSIHISDIASLSLGSGVTAQTKSEQELTNTFYLKTTHSKYVFRCRNQDERDNWMAAILTAISSSLLKQR